MKRKSIISLLSIMLVMVIGLIFVRVPNAAEVGGGTGKISGRLVILPNETARQHLYGQSGTIPNRLSDLAAYDNVEVSLLDQNGNKVASMLSGNGLGKGEYEFTNIPDGNYFIEIASVNNAGDENEVIPSLDTNGLMNINGKAYQPQRRSESITISNGTDVKEIDFAIVLKPYALKLKTGIGKFQYRVNGQEQESDTINYYEGGIRTFLYSGRRYLSVAGVLATDRLNHTINSLPKPGLSQEEIDFGYSFAGWILDDEMLAKYPEYERYRNVPLTENGVLNIQAHGDITLRAAFSWPIHKITFASDSSKGLVESEGGSSAYAIARVQGNTRKLTELPTVATKPGYRFLGWYKDMTTNVVPNEDILNEVIKGDMTYYAKYEAVEPEVSIRPSIMPAQEGDMSISGKSIANSDITLTLPDGTELATSSDADGNWSFDLENSLEAGQVVSARQTEAGKLISPFIDLTVIRAIPEKTANPIVTVLKEGDVAVVGKGIPGAMIQVTFKNYGSATTLVAEDGTWSVPVIQGADVAYGDNVFVVQTENGKLSSSSTDATAIKKDEPKEEPQNNNNQPTPPVTPEVPNVPNTSGGGSGGGSSSRGGGNVTPRVVNPSTPQNTTPTPTPDPIVITTPEPQAQVQTPVEETPVVKLEEPVVVNQNAGNGNRSATRVVRHAVPKTDDRSNMLLWASMLVMSLGMGIVAIKKNK